MIFLKKTGIFYENDVKPDRDGYVYEQVESIIPYLDEWVDIDDDFTLKDFFEFVAQDEGTMQVVFGSQLGHHPLAPYLEEAQQDCMPENTEEEIEYIECSWVAEQFDYRLFYEAQKGKENSVAKHLEITLHEPDEDDENEITIYVDVHGIGPHVENDDAPAIAGTQTPTSTAYGIEFTPLHKLAHLPIRLNTSFTMGDRNEVGDDKPVVEGRKYFSVYTVFGAILSEISFCGLPEDRDEQWKDIVDRVDEIKEQEEYKNDDDDEDE